MGVTFKSMSAVGTSTRTNTTIPAPANIVNGDLLIILEYLEVLTATPPAGFVAFTGLGPLTFPINTSTTLWAWRKVASGEAGDYTVTHANASANAVMLVYPGQDTTIEDVAPSTNTGSANPNLLANGVTVATPGSMIIYAAAMFNVPPNPPVIPSGVTPTFTERWNTHQSVDDWGLFVADGQAAAGATGNKIGTDGPTLDDWVATLITIRAKAAPASALIPVREELI